MQNTDHRLSGRKIEQEGAINSRPLTPLIPTYWLRYLQENGLEDYAAKIHMPPVSKQATIPSVWTVYEPKQLISVIDRNSPIGKRDY